MGSIFYQNFERAERSDGHTRIACLLGQVWVCSEILAFYNTERMPHPQNIVFCRLFGGSAWQLRLTARTPIYPLVKYVFQHASLYKKELVLQSFIFKGTQAAFL